MKRLTGIAALTVLLTGCPFDGGNTSNANGANPTPTASPAATATPSSSASPSPTATATAAPTATPAATAPSGGGTNPTPTPTASAAPTAAPTATPATGSGLASSCFNADLYAKDTQIDWTYDSTGGNGSASFRDLRTVTGPATFKGQNAIKSQGTTDTTDSNGSTSSTMTSTYSQLDSANHTARQLGVETSSAAQGFTVNSVITIKPARQDRFNLSANQSYTLNFETTTQTTVSGFTNTTTAQTDAIRKFNGIESVTVPAGTMNACKFTETGSQTINGQSASYTTTTWFDVDSGVLLRQVSGDTTSVLRQGSVNGIPVQ